MKTKSSNRLLASLTKAELDKLLKNYEVNNTLIEQGLYPKNLKPVVKFFNPTGIGTWYLTELSPSVIGFGICHLHEIDLGYVCLDELATLRFKGGLRVEKDRYFSNQGLTLESLLEKLNEGKYF